MTTIEQRITNCIFYLFIIILLIISLCQEKKIREMSDDILTLKAYNQEVWRTIYEDHQKAYEADKEADRRKNPIQGIITTKEQNKLAK